VSTTRTPPTDDELRDAYRRSRLLEECGITFEQAQATPMLLASLRGMVASDRRWAASTLHRGSMALELRQVDKS
jgi:hypothetical protein